MKVFGNHPGRMSLGALFLALMAAPPMSPPQGLGGGGGGPGVRGEWDFIVYSSDGVNVTMYDAFGNTLGSGTDWVTLVNTQVALGQTSNLGDVVKGSFYINPNVPASTTTLLIADRSGITLFCPKREGGYSTETRPPRTYKVLIQAVTTFCRRISVHGLQFYEIEIQHSAQNIRAITFDKCASQDWSSLFPGRRGLRFTGSGAGGIEHVTFKDHYAAIVNAGQSASDPTSFISFESQSLVTGHIQFDNLLAENSGFGTSAAVVYRSGGRTGPRVQINGSMVGLGGPVGFSILRTNVNSGAGIQDSGPAELVFADCHFEIQTAATTIVDVLDNPTVGSIFKVVFDNPRFAMGNFAYTMISNVNTGAWVGQPRLQWTGGEAISGAGTSWSWTIGTPGSIQFIPHRFEAIDTGTKNAGQVAWFYPGMDNRSGITANDGAPITVWPATPTLAWGGTGAVAVLLFRVSIRIMCTAFTSGGPFVYTFTWQENAGTRTRTVQAAALNITDEKVFLVQNTTGTAMTVQVTGFGVGTVKVACHVEVVGA